MKPTIIYLVAFLVLPIFLGCTDAPETNTTSDPEPQLSIDTVRKIDVHAHYWQPHDDLIPKLDTWNMGAVLVNVASSSNIDEKWAGMLALQQAHPDHFVLCSTFDPFRFNEPNFAENVVEELKVHIEQGAKMVKVWKNIGLELKDENGEYVFIDHPRFQPIWDYLSEAGIPVLAHIAEPRAAWLPLDEKSPHYFYYRDNPEYHAYQHPEMPRWETIIEARDRWVERNPSLTIVAAHLGSMSHDVDEVAARLDRFPNLYVETAARFKDLTIQPSEKVRAFMLKYQDRILYGTDVNNGTVERNGMDEFFERQWNYVSSPDSVYFGNPESWGVKTQGLGLPRDVLDKFYAGNLISLLGLQ